MIQDAGTLHEVTGGGTAGEHIPLPAPPVFVAPTISGKDHNTIKTNAVPFACWRADDARFEFDSSFVQPQITEEISVLHTLISQHTLPDDGGAPVHKPVLTVFGHADPVGDESYNKALSGRRAQAVFALLTRNAELWDDLFSHPLGGDRWDPVAIVSMQDALGRPRDERPTGAARLTLFKEYMDLVCTVRDAGGDPAKGPGGAPVRLELKPSDFLGAGTGPGNKGDFQGCGEFNPALVFSSDEQDRLSKPGNAGERNAANAPNRRVLILLFRPGVHIRPADWPCPGAKDGPDACRARFWADHKARLAPAESRRTAATGSNTFACRFYDRLVSTSPCERADLFAGGKIHMEIYDAEGQNPLAGRHYSIRRAGQDNILYEGSLDDDGRLRHDGVPPGDYTLSVQDCRAIPAALVLAMNDDEPQVRMLD